MSKADLIRQALRDGLTYAEITKQTGASKANISYHAKKIGLSRARELPSYDWNAIQAFHDLGNPLVVCRKRFGFDKNTWYKAVERGAITPRCHLVPLEDACVIGSTYSRGTLKRRLIAEGILAPVCAECGVGTEWNGKPLTLALDHKNGVNNDNRLDNLRLLCPNCHSQTETFAGRNVKR